MSEILQIFTGNPLTTFVGKKIEAATRPDLESDDWALNLEICDMINENDDDARDAARAIRKRLQQIEQDRDFTITNRTLTVLETCVSNCSKRFHVLVMTKDFIQDLIKLIGPKNNPPIDLQERVLRLIERWAEAFRNQSDLSGVVTVFNELKTKGVTFPAPDPNYNVPIQTPQRSVAPQRASSPSVRSNLRGHSPNHPLNYQQSQHVPSQTPQPVTPIVLEGDGYNKISQDLTVVQTSVDMFNDIMGVLETKGDDESDWKLAADLNVTCHQMKDRIVDLIERVANEDLTMEFLRLNDDLNNIFIKYDRLVKNRSKLTSQVDRSRDTPTTPMTSTSATSASIKPDSIRQDNELSLIDFNADDSFKADKNEKKTEPVTIDDPFDSSRITEALAKSTSSQHQASVDPLTEGLDRLTMNNNLKSTTNNNKSSGRLPEEISSVREQDFAEIENWLKTDSGRSELTSITGDLSSVEPVSITNSEFENFLANRAQAGSSITPVSSTQTSSKTIQKPEPSV